MHSRTVVGVAVMNKLYKTIEKEIQEPVSATVSGEYKLPYTGTIPEWVEGSLYRNGPGMFEFGENRLNHFFDGMAMIQRFHISGGEVRYQRRFLPTDTYKKNIEAQTNVYGNFGTAAMPDPCLNIFQRFLAYFKSGKLTDNTLVSLFPFNNELYATTETSYINKVQMDTLDREEKVDLMKSAGLFLSAAHPHWDKEGRVHYLGHNFTGGLKTNIVTFLPNKEESPIFPRAQHVCSIHSPWKVHISYYHSFGITENYYILAEQSLMFNVAKLALPPLAKMTVSEAMQWYPDTPVRFRIIDRKTGALVNSHVTYQSKAFLCFHHINAYEEDDHIVLDLVCHKDRRLLDQYFMKELSSEQWLQTLKKIDKPEARRYVIPLDVENQSDGEGNLVSLSDTLATCLKMDKNVYHCTYERLADVGVEFPTISYDRYNGHKYRYMYGTKFETTASQPFSLLKIDTVTKTSTEWESPNCYPSEPVFIPRPGGSGEDDGVIVAAVNRSDYCDGHKPFLIVLDAKTMTEVARAEISDVERFPVDLHGIFVPQ